jgi:hypothetical protein
MCYLHNSFFYQYDNLQKYKLPFPEAIFDLDFFRSNPQPFVSLAREIWPGHRYVPTITHSFIALLAKKGLLLRNYTQNIDGLEYLANIPTDKIVEWYASDVSIGMNPSLYLLQSDPVFCCWKTYFPYYAVMVTFVPLPALNVNPLPISTKSSRRWSIMAR